MVLLPQNKGLVVGDLIHHNSHAWLEGGIVGGAPTPNLSAWIELLQDIKDDFSNFLPTFGGRGEVTSLKNAVDTQTNYLKVAEEIVEEYVLSVEEKESFEGETSAAHYQKISQLFSKEFPQYELGYLIDYGVYGLVNSKL